jgi:transcriptional regulator with XRE-family HTH domain
LDQLKIGRFITEQRKSKNLTQSQLAEKLFVTDKAVSKWERGKSMPDSAIMLELCAILDISVNELLNGTKMQK